MCIRDRPSGQLVNLSAAELGWKKSTTYTVLKKHDEKVMLTFRRFGISGDFVILVRIHKRCPAACQ